MSKLHVIRVYHMHLFDIPYPVRMREAPPCSGIRYTVVQTGHYPVWCQQRTRTPEGHTPPLHSSYSSQQRLAPHPAMSSAVNSSRRQIDIQI